MNLQELSNLRLSEVKTLSKTLRLPQGQRAKGGKWRAFTKPELAKAIRRQVSSGYFPDTLARFKETYDEMVDGTYFPR